MIGQTIIVSEVRANGSTAAVNPGGTISSAIVYRYARTASVAGGQGGGGSVAWNGAEPYSEYDSGGTYVTGTSRTVTATPAVGYVFDEWSGDTDVAGVTVNGNRVTVSASAAAQDIAIVANFRKKVASDGYNVLLRWKSIYSAAEGAAEVERELRVVSGALPSTNPKPTSSTARSWSSTSTDTLFAVVPTDGGIPGRRTIYGSDGNPRYYIANYFPLAGVDGETRYWIRRNVGAVRADGITLLGWELRARSGGDVLARLPADGTTTINEIAEAIDGYEEDAEQTTWYNSASLGDYHIAFLEAVWGNPHDVSVSFSGANADEPDVSASPASASAGETVTLAAQTTGLATCEFSSWSATDADGDPVPVTEGDSGVATFEMPDAGVSAVAQYVTKKFSVSVGYETGGSASVEWRESDDDVWHSLPQDGKVEYGSQVRFSATELDDYVFIGWYVTGSDSPYSVSQPYVIESLSEDIALTAKFQSGSAPQSAVIEVVAQGNGKVDILGGSNHGAAEDGANAHATFDIGDDVTLVAEFSSEYVFVGWYAGGVLVSEQPVHAFKFGADGSHSYTNYTARFGVSDNAIYEWEGSDENKEIEWTSKVYTAPKPFDPVAARVDAAGYPVDLTVRTYSSPDVADALPVRDHELTAANPVAVQSQDGRRLPRMRPERYVRFTVKSTHEIDTVVIGTNMAEVN